MTKSKRIEWNPKLVKLNVLVPYEKSGKKNPRIIDEFGLSQLEASFDDIGMMQPLAANLDNTILSGHARWMQLSKENPDGEVYVMFPDRMLTPKQEEAVIIRANKNIAGKWDFNELANNYEIEDLMKYGFSGAELAIFDNLEKLDNETKFEDIEGMPDFSQEDQLAHKSVKVNFATDHHFAEFFKLIGQPFTEKTKSIWYPEAKRDSVKNIGFVEDEEI